MPPFVPDASVSLPWCFGDERTSYTEALLDSLIEGEEVIVPRHARRRSAQSGPRRGRAASGASLSRTGPPVVERHQRCIATPHTTIFFDGLTYKLPQWLEFPPAEAGMTI